MLMQDMLFILLRLQNVFLNQYAKYRLLNVRTKIFNAALMKGKIWEIGAAHMIRLHVRWTRPYLLILVMSKYGFSGLGTEQKGVLYSKLLAMIAPEKLFSVLSVSISRPYRIWVILWEELEFITTVGWDMLFLTAQRVFMRASESYMKGIILVLTFFLLIE